MLEEHSSQVIKKLDPLHHLTALLQTIHAQCCAKLLFSNNNIPIFITYTSRTYLVNQDSVAGSVIQAFGMVVFEDVLKTVAW